MIYQGSNKNPFKAYLNNLCPQKAEVISLIYTLQTSLEGFLT